MWMKQTLVLTQWLLPTSASVPLWDARSVKRLIVGRFGKCSSHCGTLDPKNPPPNERDTFVNRGAAAKGWFNDGRIIDEPRCPFTWAVGRAGIAPGVSGPRACEASSVPIPCGEKSSIL